MKSFDAVSSRAPRLSLWLRSLFSAYAMPWRRKASLATQDRGVRLDASCKLVLVVLAVGLVLRLLTLNNALAFDELVQTRAVFEANEYGLDKYTEMNPLTTWTRLLVTSFLGVEVWSLRFTSLIFAALTIWVTFLLARELYGKKTALWAVVLLSLSAWHALVSTSVSFDGAFLTFYTVLALLCFVKHEKTKQRSWLVACGIALGLCVLTKYTGVLVFFALLLYALLRKTRFRQILRDFSIVGIAGIATFSIFPLVAFVFSDPNYFWVTLQHGTGYFGGRAISIPLLFIQYGLALLWMGPLLLFGYFLSFTKFEKNDWLHHALIIVIFGFYTFVVQDPFRPVERYFTILLPSLCLLTGKCVAGLKFGKKQQILLGTTFAAALALFFALNALPAKILALYPKTNFITAVLSLDWNFLVPFTGDQGPVGLYVNFLIFAIAFIAGAGLFVLASMPRLILWLRSLFSALTWRRRRKASVEAQDRGRQASSWAAILLLGIGLALGVFVMTELALHPTSPNISAVVKETASFVKTSQMEGPFYTFRDYAMQHYLNAPATNIDFDADPAHMREMLVQGGTLMVIDFPALDKNGSLWQMFTNTCEKKATVEDKGIPLGHVFSC